MSSRLALVAGASTGLGGFVCRYLARNGYEIVALCPSASRRGLAPLKQIECDEFNLDDCWRASMAVHEDFGPIDVLVICPDASHKEDNVADQRAGVLDASLDRVFNITRSFLKVMGQNGKGRIVTILPSPDRHSASGSSNASTTRAALSGFARSLAALLAEEGVTVNTISLGGTSQTTGPEMLPDVGGTQSIEAEADDARIADAVMYLVSDAGSSITGADILV